MTVIKEHGIYFLTGSLRSGKGLTAVSKIKEVLLDGRRVATNMDLKLENMLGPMNKTANVLRLPDHPTVEDLEAMGLGYEHDDPEHYDESKFGLLALDELATFLNARTWNDKGRKAFIDWLLMSGKKRWILMMTIQDLELLDKQIKAALASQYVVKCKSLSKYSIPLLSPIFKLFTGRPLTLPKSYLGVVKVGTDVRAVTHDTWWHFGTQLYSAYNTAQVYLDREHSQAKMLCTMLPPWYIKGRYLPKKDISYYRAIISKNLEYVAVASVAGVIFSVSSFLVTLVSSFSAKATQIEQLQRQVVHLSQAVEKIPSVALPDAVHDEEIINCDDESRFDHFYINGSYRTPKGIQYLITDNSISYRTTELLSYGAKIRGAGNCSLTVLIDNCSYSLNCDSSVALPVSPARADGQGNRKGGNESPSVVSDKLLGAVSTAL